MSQRIFAVLILNLVFVFGAFAQCSPESTKMMVLGDSWAFFSWTGNSYNENLDRFGLTDIRCKSNASLSVSGTEANDYFTDLDRVEELRDFIQSNPDLEVVHFSLGGNDILGDWHKDMTRAEEDALLSTLIRHIREGMNTIWSMNSELLIHFSGYDYPNFAETVSTTSPDWLQRQHPFYGRWDGMGKPDPTELNAIVIRATQIFTDSIANHDQVSFVNNLGLMQWYHGQEEELEVFPFDTYAPRTAPVPGGFPNYPTPVDALNLGGNDAFHLDNHSYEIFIQRHFEEFYWEYFRNADTSFYSDIANNGSVSEAISSDQLILGNSTNATSKSILSFNTENFESREIDAASIYLQRESLEGDNLIDAQLSLEIKAGFFGSEASLELDDFLSPSDAVAIACTYGTIEENGSWMRIDIPEELLIYFDYGGTTQFRLTYDIAEENRSIGFVNDTNNIILDITYGDYILNTDDDSRMNSALNVYPNPCSDVLYLDKIEGVSTIQLVDLLGRVVLTGNEDADRLNVSSIDQGVYFLRCDIEGEMISRILVKE